jgi:hypothetical protein
MVEEYKWYDFQQQHYTKFSNSKPKQDATGVKTQTMLRKNVREARQDGKPMKQMGKRGQAGGLGSYLDVFMDLVISGALVFLVIATILGFMADEKSDIEAEYGTNSTASEAISTGETELSDLTGDAGTVIGVIVLFVVVLLFVRLKRANSV